MIPSPAGPLLTPSEADRRLHKRNGFTAELIAQAHIHAIRHGARWLVPLTEVQRISGQPADPLSEARVRELVDERLRELLGPLYAALTATAPSTGIAVGDTGRTPPR
jgi:hypothetical protein